MQEFCAAVLEELRHETALVLAAVLGMQSGEFAKVGAAGDVLLDGLQLGGGRRIGFQHDLERGGTPNDFVCLRLVVGQVLLQRLLGGVRDEAHLLAEDLAQIVDHLGAPAADHSQRHRVALGRRQIHHARRVQAVALQRPLAHLDEGDRLEQRDVLGQVA